MPIETPEAVEPSKPSKLNRIKSAALAAGFYGTFAVITGGSMYFSYKMLKMQYDAAQLNLEAAKAQLKNQ